MVIRLLISVGFLFLVTAPVNAGWFGADFSADIYRVTATSEQRTGRMFVGQGRVRTEMSGKGVSLVEIIDPVVGKAWLLNLELKQYRERPVPKHVTSEVGKPDLCQDMLNISCTRSGRDTVNGRKSSRWRLNGAEIEQLVWIDHEHGFPLRVVENGRVKMEMQFVETAKYAGREVEKWRTLIAGPDGVRTLLQWYDPHLNIAVRRQLPNGSAQELRNIRLGEQGEALFVVPENYRPAIATEGEQQE